jgi:trigger factor
MSVEATVASLEGLEKKLSVTVSADTINKEYDKKFKSVASTIRLPGFRKGKIPVGVVQSRYGQSIFSEVAQDLISSSLQTAIQDNKCLPVAMPKVDVKQFEQGKDLIYDALFEEFPEIKTADFSKCKVTLEEAEITDSDIDTAITAVQQQQAKWKETEDKSKKGDQVIVNFVGTIDKEEFEGGTANDFKVILGGGSVLPEFDKALTGVKKGDKTKAKLTFPKDYHSADLAGKKAEFAIDVQQVENPELPEINEEFIKNFGVESGEIGDFREEVKKPLEVELGKTITVMKEKHVFDLIEKEYKKLDVPKTLVAEEIKNSMERNRIPASGDNAEIKPGDKNPIAQDAERNVKLSLVCQHLVKEYDLKLDKERFDAYLKSLAGSYMAEKEFMEWFYKDAKRVEQIQANVLQMQLMDAVLDKADTKTEKVTFEKLREISQS